MKYLYGNMIVHDLVGENHGRNKQKDSLLNYKCLRCYFRLELLICFLHIQIPQGTYNIRT